MKHLGRLCVHFLSSLLLKHRLALGAVPLALRLRCEALKKFLFYFIGIEILCCRSGSSRIRINCSGSGSDFIDMKICLIFGIFFLKMVHFVFDYINISIENLKNAFVSLAAVPQSSIKR
jgi:hypothetical protein